MGVAPPFAHDIYAQVCGSGTMSCFARAALSIPLGRHRRYGSANVEASGRESQSLYSMAVAECTGACYESCARES